MLSSLNIFHRKDQVEVDDSELKSRRTFQLYQAINAAAKAANHHLSGKRTPAAKAAKKLLTEVLPQVKEMIVTYETSRTEIYIMSTYYQEYQLLEAKYQTAKKNYERLQKEDMDGQAYYENKKRELREKITELQGDETRKIALRMTERNTQIATLTQQRVKHVENIRDIKDTPAGCCGALSKKQVKSIRQHHDDVEKIESAIGLLLTSDLAIEDIQDRELESLKKKLAKVREELKEHLKSYPVMIAAAKQALDDAEMQLREDEVMLVQFKNVFYAGIPNHLMFHILRMYIFFSDLKQLVLQMDTKSSNLLTIKETFNLKDNYAKQLLKSLWCPGSKDKSGLKFLESIFPADPTQMKSELSKIIRSDSVISDEMISKVIPPQPGNLFKRLEEGRLDGAPPQFIHLQTDATVDSIVAASSRQNK
jgi:hypothetical protein